MKSKKTVLIIGLVLIAVIAAGTVIGINLSMVKPTIQSTTTVFLNTLSNNTTVSVKKGDVINLTLPDFGDGGYNWVFTSLDKVFLQKTAEKLNWGSSGMLGDFGKDTWMFTALQTGHTTVQLQCVRLFNESDISQTFTVSLTIS
jgi:predicted secreted protein